MQFNKKIILKETYFANLSYISNTIEEIFEYKDGEIKDYLKKTIIEIAQEGNIYHKIFSYTVIHQFPEIFKEEEIPSDVKTLFLIMDYLQKPPYENIVKNRKITVLIDYADSAYSYLEELRKLFKGEGFFQRYSFWKRYTVEKPLGSKKIKYIVKGKINGIDLEIHLTHNIKEEEFRKILESEKYSLIFTRHHSYEGESFGGYGSSKVLPQFIGTLNTGKGPVNNLFGVVLLEEIAKGVGQNKNWEQIWKAMKKRMNIDNFIPPNHLSFLISYAMIIQKLIQNNINLSLENSPFSVIIFDGGCGGINRIPEYIEKYKISSSSLLKEEISSFLNQPPGGIDLNPNFLKLNIYQKQNLNLPTQILPFNLNDFLGFDFQILEIKEINDLKELVKVN
jgi:hypothetical protein